MEVTIGNSRLITNKTRDERDAVGVARGEGDRPRLGNARQLAGSG